MRENPLIFSGHAVKRTKDAPDGASGTTDRGREPPSKVTEQKGDLLIRDLWHNMTDSVHNMRVTNTDAKSHSAKTPEKCLQEAERGNNWMYVKAYLQKCRHFSPFVASVDELLGV